MIKGFLLGILGVFVGVAAVGFFKIYPPTEGIGGSFTGQRECTISTSTLAIMGDHSRLILGESSRRAWAEITMSTSTDAYLGFGQAAVRQGLLVASGTMYSINQDNLFTGDIFAISRNTSASTTVGVVECSY